MSTANVNGGGDRNIVAAPALPLKLAWPSSAVALTVALFLLMAHLITPQGGVPQSAEEDVKIDISRKDREEPSGEKKRTRPNEPVREETPPPPAIPENRPRALANDGALLVDLPRFDGDGSEFTFNADRRATPIVRIPPEYPRGPLARNIEGWVLVEFTITRTGTVTDARVVDSEPPGVFDRATLRAIARWKYQPKVVNGEAVPQHNMRELFHYEITDGS